MSVLELVKNSKIVEPAIDFTTFEKRKVYNENGEEIASHSAITNVKTGEVNAIMSSRYTIFNHDKAYDIIEQAAKGLCPTAKSNVDFSSGNGFMKVIYDLPQEYNVQVGEGDSLKTRLVGFNSVDGTKSLSFHIDFERLVCSNGMVGFSREFSFTRRHSKFIHEDTDNFNIAAQIKTAHETVIANAMKLKNNAVDFRDGMDAIRELVDRKLFPKKLESWISEEWRRATANANSIQAENGSNLWTLYNSFTSAITHSTDKKGNELSNQQKELYGRRINNVIMKLAQAA